MTIANCTQNSTLLDLHRMEGGTVLMRLFDQEDSTFETKDRQTWSQQEISRKYCSSHVYINLELSI